MKAFDKQNGWLYQTLGGPVHKELWRVDNTRGQAPEDPPHVTQLVFAAHPEGMYKAHVDHDREAVYRGVRYPMWVFKWEET